MKRYLLAHWRGEQSMLIALLINGVLGYFVVVAVMFGISELVPAGMILGFALSAVWMIWASVGIIRCALKRYIPASQPPWRRLIGLLVTGLVAVVYILTLGDLWYFFGP
jgi:hypothetical protein